MEENYEKTFFKEVTFCTVGFQYGNWFCICINRLWKQKERSYQIERIQSVGKLLRKADRWSADILKKKFNVELNIIPEGDGVFETRMTSGNLGDIVVWGADNDKYPLAVKNNLLFGWEDDNVLDEYGPYIKKNMPDALKKNKELTKTITNGASDKLYGLVLTWH